MLNSMLRSEPFELEKNLKPAQYFTEGTTAYKALEKFRETKQHVGVVTDESGRVQGLLTMNDLIDALVGDLAEQLHAKKEIIPREDGSFIVDASLSMHLFGILKLT